jgi:HK97 family phage major capsid protein
MKLKPQVRFLQMAGTSPVIGADRTLTFPFSSEIPVSRWYGNETLMHDENAADFSRLNSSAPLLFNHGLDDVVGVVEKAWVNPQERRGYATVRFAKTARGDEVMGMVQDRILPNVSFMYRIDAATEDPKTNDIRVTKFTPLEISIVTVPADNTVGIGRAYASEETEVQITRASTGMMDCPECGKEMSDQADACPNCGAVVNPADPATTKGADMPEATTVPAGQVAESELQAKNPIAYEQARKQAIINLVRANKLDERIGNAWITQGASMEQVSKDILEILEERGKNNPEVSATKVGLSNTEVRQYSLMRALRAASSNDWSEAGLEREASLEVAKRIGRSAGKQSFFVPMEVQKRDLTVASASGGGYLKATDNMSFIELLRNRMVVRAMGAQVLSGLVGDVTIPKQTAAATGYWLADEATAITESQQTFGQLALSPRTVGALTQISRKLMLQSSPSVEQLVLSDLAKVVAIAVDLAAIAGTGTEQPTGIINTGSIGGFTGTSLASPGVLNAQADVADANALSGSLGYVTTPTVASLLMARPELPTSGTTRLWQGNMLEGSIFGFRAMTTAQMPAGDMIFGDWSQLVIAEWGVLELATSESANTADFHKGITTIRAFYSVDVGVRYVGAFSLATSIT